jgi:hypothetical protein
LQIQAKCINDSGSEVEKAVRELVLDLMLQFPSPKPATLELDLAAMAGILVITLPWLASPTFRMSELCFSLSVVSGTLSRFFQSGSKGIALEPMLNTLESFSVLSSKFCLIISISNFPAPRDQVHNPPFHHAPKLKEDGSNATAVKDWGINDGKVMAVMVNSTKQSLIMSLSKFKTAVIPCYIPLGSPSTSAP